MSIPSFDPPGKLPSACFICGDALASFITKQFKYDALKEVEYVRCQGCGVVLSKTHYELPPHVYSALNQEYFSDIYKSAENPLDPRWRMRLDAQARFLTDLFRVLGKGTVVDFGAGDGYLTRKLAPSCHTITAFDLLAASSLAPFGTDPSLRLPQYLLATSVLEHLFGLPLFDMAKGLTGNKHFFFCYHTLVCEAIPRDPSWFYLTPLHSTFFTNKAMELALRKAGFVGCVYAPAAKMWVSTAGSTNELQAQLLEIAGAHKLVFRDGFVDYWKGQPVRRIH